MCLDSGFAGFAREPGITVLLNPREAAREFL
jgi:hypothetical protein